MEILSLLSSQDTYVSQWYPSTNFNNSNALFVSQYQEPGDEYRSFLQFHLEQIPPTSTVEKAILELTMYRNEVVNPITINAHRLLNYWNQSSITWKNQVLYEQLSNGNVIIKNESPLGKIFIDITELVKGWHNGSITNYGLVLKGSEQVNSLVAFRSTNFADPNTWPVLQVTFINEDPDSIDAEELFIPEYPPYAPLVASTPIFLGLCKQATFLVKNASNSCHLQAIVQVGYSNDKNATFFNTGSWIDLKAEGYPGEAIALTTNDVAEYARLLVKGKGGETIYVWARTCEC
ncbi:MAG TPA: DNRLRE domain-containing protein [Syntrophomonadaceae bacterium]|nr:DNRLRE domain-containing protein [Syntrophomonadaceae bacterium]